MHREDSFGTRARKPEGLKQHMYIEHSIYAYMQMYVCVCVCVHVLLSSTPLRAARTDGPAMLLFFSAPRRPLQEGERVRAGWVEVLYALRAHRRRGPQILKSQHIVPL